MAAISKLWFVMGGTVSESRYWAQIFQLRAEELGGKPTWVSVLKTAQTFLTASEDSVLVLVGTALFRQDIDEIIAEAQHNYCPILDRTRDNEVIIPSARIVHAHFKRLEGRGSR